MRIFPITFLTTLFVMGTLKAGFGQADTPLHPSIIGKGVFLGVTPPLKDLPVLSAADYAAHLAKAERKALNKKMELRSYPYADIALPKGTDPIWQQTMGPNSSRAPLVNFGGQASPYYPPDCNGTAGPNHFMQTINSVYAIYNKSGTLVAGPTNMNLLFGSVTGATYNDGDPLILYDEQASRWLAVEFSISGSNDYMLVAVSTTNNPTGTWYTYSFDVADMPDYEKFGIWQDGYYMGTNNSSGNDIYVFQRSVMLTGGASPQFVGFDNSWRPTTVDGFMCVPPVDNDGAAAPSGSPGLFITINDDAIGGGSDQLWIYQLAVNWTTPSSSTFTRSQQLSVPAFDSNFGTTWDNITQPTSQKLDAIPMVIMNVPQYRNFGTYETLVCCHTVDVDATNHAGIRWYELRRVSGGSWSVRQSGTYAPDAANRWMGSIMLNGSGQLGLGYSVSSSSIYPSIRYCGQSSTAYNNATGTMDITEEVIQAGAYAQSSYNRWGDYSLMSVDPSDDKTFWFTTEYLGSGGTRQTKIASFKFGNAPTVTTLAASSVTSVSATLNGSVNPSGLATTYYFQYGLTTSYGSTTTSTSAGSGTTAVSVNAAISGLTGGQTYHFRVVAVNSDGTSNGNDLTFIPGGAGVTTTTPSAITMTTATGGGNVTYDGGATVSAKGVCWATTANPVVTGNHTTDGSGLGTFTSSITGLTANTTYHVRAYATNANGTFYGEDITFSTLCGIYSLPFTESFTNTTLPSCWTQVDNQGSGQIWQFGTITGQSPNPSLTGNYAYLNSDAYGSGSSQNADLVTPPLNLSPYSSVTLGFKHYFKSYSGSSGTVSYSLNNGTTWTSLATYSSTSSTNPTTVSLAANATAGQAQVKFKWNYVGTYAYYWAIDDISITGNCTANPVSVSISCPATTVCPGTSVTYTAVPTNGGTTPAYQWKVNGSNVTGATNTTYTYTPANSDQVTCVLTSNVSCPSGNPATSNMITMTVSSVPVSVAISASSNPVCQGNSVTLTATPTNGGTTPAYQWKVNGSNVTTATNATYTYTPAGGDQVTCVLTSNVSCPSGNPATSNTVTMTVNPTVTAGVSIAASANPVCQATSVTFTATPANGGSTPAYQWKVNGSNATGATNATYTYAPANGNQVTCIMTSNASCVTGSPASSNAVSMTVNAPTPAGITISASANPVCEGNTVTYTATPVNGGSSPSYIWKVNSIATPATTNSTFQHTPQDGDVVICVMTSNSTCVTSPTVNSNSIEMTVNYPLTVGITITASANPVCQGASVTFTATPMNGGSTPSYQWKVNGSNISFATNSTYTYLPVNGDQLTCVLTSSESCISGNPATSAALTMTVNPPVAAGVSIAASANPVCQGTGVTVAATPVNGGSTPAYQWKVNGSNAATATNATYTYTPADGDQITCMMTSNASCATGNPATSSALTMTVTPTAVPSITIAASFNPVATGLPVTFTAEVADGGTTPAFQWKVNGGIVTNATNVTYTYTPADGDLVSCELTSSASCPTVNPVTSNVIGMSVLAMPLSVIVQNESVSDTRCYEAYQTITVAGGSTTFTVHNGGSATFIAGSSILYYPGTRVDSGGYMTGYIAPAGPWCNTQSKVISAIPREEAATVNQGNAYRIYPNPARDRFFIENITDRSTASWMVEIYDMNGAKVDTRFLDEKRVHEFSLDGKPTGIYLVRVITDVDSGTTRIIKQQ